MPGGTTWRKPNRHLSPMVSVDDLWLVDFGEPFPSEPAFARPALVLGPPDTFGRRFPVVIVAPLTTTDRSLPLHVEVQATAQTGLRRRSFVQCELIRSINEVRLIRRLGIIDRLTAEQVDGIVRVLLNH